MRNIFICLFILSAFSSFAQEGHFCLSDSIGVFPRTTYYESWNGYYHQSYAASSITPTGNYRLLNIMVNINYDQTPDLDPAKDDAGTYWPKATIQGINDQSTIPSYLADFMDVQYNPGQVNGMMTRLFHESSFGRLCYCEH